MTWLKSLKKILLSLKQKFQHWYSQAMSQEGEVRSPSKWLKDWYEKSTDYPVKQKLSQMQSRPHSLKHTAPDEELSKVLDDALEDAPSSKDKETDLFGR